MSRNFFGSAARWQTDGKIDGLGRERKTHCKHGHKFPDDARESTNWKGYKCRVCPECDRLRMARKRENPEFKAKCAAGTKKWRLAHPVEYRAGIRKRYQERNKWIQAFKTKCKFCDESRFPCLDFHHRDSGEKLGTIGQVRHWPQDKLLAEIEKCDVVCANCHRWHHYLEKTSEGEGK